MIGAFGCLAITENIVPTSTITAGDTIFPSGSTHANLAQQTDAFTVIEGPTGPASMNACPAADNFGALEVLFAAPVGTPGLSDCQGMRYTIRFRKADSGHSSGNYFDGEVNVGGIEIEDGATQIKINDFDDDITTTYVTESEVFSVAQYENISDFGDLRLRTNTITGCADDDLDGGPGCEISRCQIEFFVK